MAPIGVCDRLRIEVAAGAECDVALVATGLPTPGGSDNLAHRAAALFLRRSGQRAAVRLHLEKRIPSGAGLGGGSSDAAAVLRTLDSLLKTSISREKLTAWALELGADVPFFIAGRPARIGGIGEEIEPLSDWPRDTLVVAFAGAPLATAEVFRAYDASLTSSDGASNIRVFAQGHAAVAPGPVNDLETAAFQIDPGIQKLKEGLLEHGGRAVVMTGSGAAVFGFWPEVERAREVAARLRDAGHWAEVTQILESVPSIEVE
jgi:4-diphosphocytidyl-2-C-methyl-D-erythritol kinase